MRAFSLSASAGKKECATDTYLPSAVQPHVGPCARDKLRDAGRRRMIRQRTILSLALLASTAACGGGGGGGSAPAASGGAPALAANPTGCSNWFGASSSDANGFHTWATVSSVVSQTATLVLSGDV